MNKSLLNEKLHSIYQSYIDHPNISVLYSTKNWLRLDLTKHSFSLEIHSIGYIYIVRVYPFSPSYSKFAIHNIRFDQINYLVKESINLALNRDFNSAGTDSRFLSALNELLEKSSISFYDPKGPFMKILRKAKYLQLSTSYKGLDKVSHGPCSLHFSCEDELIKDCFILVETKNPILLVLSYLLSQIISNNHIDKITTDSVINELQKTINKRQIRFFNDHSPSNFYFFKPLIDSLLKKLNN